MPKRSSKPKREDANQAAARILAQATEEQPAPAPEPEQPAKNPAAVALGRLGGLKGGKARADRLTKEQRASIAKKAAKARWSQNRGS